MVGTSNLGSWNGRWSYVQAIQFWLIPTWPSLVKSQCQIHDLTPTNFWLIWCVKIQMLMVEQEQTHCLYIFLCGKTHHVSWLSCSSMSIFLDQSRFYEKLVLSDWPQDEALVTWSPRWGNLSDSPDWMGIWVIFRWFCLGNFSWGYKLTKLRLLTVARGITYPYRN